MSRKKPPTIEDPSVLNILGAEYGIPWEDLPVGGSFFLPTTATAVQVAKLLVPYEQLLDIILAVRQRREFGVYGVRIWRLR